MTDIFNELPRCFNNYSLEYSCGNGAYMRIFENCDRDDFCKYSDCLKADGYKLYSENRIDDNTYLTFSGKDPTVHLYFIECESTVRVIADPFTALYDSEKQDCKKICDTVFYQFETDHSRIDCGMCYIIRCCDGSFFIIDSAHPESKNDNQRIFNFLKKISVDGKIIINGWFFSHGHDDHVGKFLDFLRENTDGVTIEAFYYNFIDLSNPESIFWSEADKNCQSNFAKLVAEFPEIKKVKLHSGQKFYCRNLCFQVLCTHEDTFPASIKDFNNTSTVLLLEAEGTKIMLPGDAAYEESPIITTRFSKETLKSDIVQASHHGHNGTSCEFYSMVNAPTVLFPTTQIKFDEEYTHFEANRVACRLAEECFISANGTVGFKLPYKVGNAVLFNDETFEDFEAIKGLWGYEYTDEYKDKLRKEFEKGHNREVKN
jgi:hypothetical protein